MDEEAPQLTGEEKQNLEDDGWVVVKKKSKKWYKFWSSIEEWVRKYTKKQFSVALKPMF